MSAKKEEEGAPATAPETEGYAPDLDAAEGEIENAPRLPPSWPTTTRHCAKSSTRSRPPWNPAPVNAAAPHTGANTGRRFPIFKF
ncbi:hypothetical protein [Neisseria meningitidis]|uniref:hypothetical protein n=1 Tax=Neisseria meningitidis TaxID=487 RepID=UPI00215DA5C1|nr:hypothetical protein [Neisseria meningitidis]